MHLIKSDLLPVKDLKKTNVFENKYSEIKNFLDLLNLSKNLYHFLLNPFLKKKKSFLHILYFILNIFL